MIAAAPAAEYAAQFAARQGRELLQDPLAYFIEIARKVGVFSLIVGVLMAIAGYYLKASATAAMNAEKTTLGQLGAIFSNIAPLTFTPAATGSEPVTATLGGVQNFFSDVATDVKALGSDLAGIGGLLGTFAEDVGAGIVDVAKVFLGFVMHFPTILWNGLVWGVGGSVADVLNWAFPWLMILGGALIIASLIAQAARGAWQDTVGAAWKESVATWSERRRLGAKARFDRILRNRTVSASVGQGTDVGKAPSSHFQGSEGIPGPSGSNPLEAPAGGLVAGPQIDAPPDHAAGADAAAEPIVGPAEGPGAGERLSPPSAAPGDPPPTEVVLVEPPPGQLTEEQLQRVLGEAFDQARDEHRAQGVPTTMPRAERPKRAPRTVRAILAEPLAVA